MSMDGDTRPRPITAAAFERLMAVLGPFEKQPHLAVGCSGGADSMALTLLLHAWANTRRGMVTALTVDHKLRPGSASEARKVKAWLRKRGIPHVTLTLADGQIDGNVQAGARAARYTAMADWCRRKGVLHLALAHHQEDQAETVLLRLARGSGVDGLAAMAPVSELPDLRLLRPLLNVSKQRLLANLAQDGQEHIEDPSNRSEAFARVRFRDAAEMLAQEGLTQERLATTAGHLARARDALELGTADVLADGVDLRDAGYALLKPKAFGAAPPEIALRALTRVVTTVAGSGYPPRFERTRRLWSEMGAEGGLATARTIGGCRILPLKAEPDRLLVCREPRAASEVVSSDARSLLWDGRFRVSLKRKTACSLRRLGRSGWAQILTDRPELRGTRIPVPVRPSLPAFWYLDAVVSVPHLNYVRHRAAVAPPAIGELTFAPRRPLTGAGFLSGLSGSESLTLGDAL